MKYQADSDGWYHQGNGYEPCRLCPIDTTTTKTWADSILMRAKNVIKYGLDNLLHDGSTYPLNDFLADTLAGDMPHSSKHLEVEYHIVACTEYTWIMSEFYRIYGAEYCPVLIEDYINELEQNRC